MNCFIKLYSEIARDKEIEPTTMKLYIVLNDLANFNTRETIIKNGTLAQKINRSIATVHRHLSKLIEFGLVERIERKSPHNPKMNLANKYIVHDIDSARYAASTPPVIRDTPPVSWMTGKKDITRNNFNSKKTTLTRGATLPITGENQPNKKENFSSQEKTLEQSETIIETKEKTTNKVEIPEIPKENLEDVPEVLKPVARYLLAFTGRKALTENETECLRKLFNQHTPIRIQKFIDEALERFKKLGRSPRELTFNYVWAALKHQRSFKKFQKNSTVEDKVEAEKEFITSEEKKQQLHKSSQKLIDTEIIQLETTETQKNAEIKAEPVLKAEPKPERERELEELIMPLEEAEKIIAEGASEQPSDPLLEKIKTKQDGLEEKMSMLDYLKLKFPNESEEVLKNQSHFSQQGKILLRDAFLTDHICAMCNGEGKCKNLYKPNEKRPKVDVIEYEHGKKRLKIKFGDLVKCRFAEKKAQSADFEQRLQKIGARPNQTFETYDASTTELKIAKAFSILAARNKTSLVLAGKQGTGKTHLATAIAVEAIKNGQSALIASTPEMLDELRQAAFRNGDDFFHMKLKYKTVSCLVLDDFGKQKSSDAGNDYLFQILDYRYRNGLQTILTTNAVCAEALCKPWDKDKILPLISRLLENGEWMTIIKADDYRLKKSDKRKKQVTQEAQKAEIPEISEVPEVEPLPTVETTAQAEALPIIEPVSETEKLPEPVLSTFSNDKPDSAEVKSLVAKTYPDEQQAPIQEQVQENISTAQRSWEEIYNSAEYQAMSEHDKIFAEWSYIKNSPEYEKLSDDCKMFFQQDFIERLEEARKRQYQDVRLQI